MTEWLKLTHTHFVPTLTLAWFIPFCTLYFQPTQKAFATVSNSTVLVCQWLSGSYNSGFCWGFLTALFRFFVQKKIKRCSKQNFAVDYQSPVFQTCDLPMQILPGLIFLWNCDIKCYKRSEKNIFVALLLLSIINYLYQEHTTSCHCKLNLKKKFERKNKMSWWFLTSFTSVINLACIIETSVSI